MAGPDQRLAQLGARYLVERQLLGARKRGQQCEAAGQQADRSAQGGSNHANSFHRIVADAAERANVTLVSIASAPSNARPRLLRRGSDFQVSLAAASALALRRPYSMGASRSRR